MYWSRKEYLERKQKFLADCEPQHGQAMFWHVWLMITLTWLAGWAISALLKMKGLGNMPVRYAISFAGSYLIFAGLVRAWANHARADSAQRSGALAQAFSGTYLAACRADCRVFCWRSGGNANEGAHSDHVCAGVANHIFCQVV